MAKVPELKADAFILDLEDAVSPNEKERAREAACRAIDDLKSEKRFCVIRINGLDSNWGSADLTAAMEANPDAILVPKINAAGQVVALSEYLSGSEHCASALWAMIETPLGFLNVQAIAALAETTPLAGFVVGTNDLAKDMGLALTADRAGVVHALSQCVLAAKAYGLTVIDGVFNNFSDLDGLAAECDQGRILGMDGKSVIHPSQIEVCNRIFGPTESDIERAKNIVAIFAQPENVNANVVAIDGEMVERLHAEAAVALLKAYDKRHSN